jgi:hypothetical protein
METYNDQGEIDNEGVWFQLKATDKVSVVGKMRAIPVRMECKLSLIPADNVGNPVGRGSIRRYSQPFG